MHNDNGDLLNENEKEISKLFLDKLELSESKVKGSVADETVSDTLKRVNHQTGTRDLLTLLMAGSFTFLIALMAPFCVKKNSKLKR
ncbi:MAG: hypothetical protein ACRBCS_09595 [Cellvibrionaceae bacterium]